MTKTRSNAIAMRRGLLVSMVLLGAASEAAALPSNVASWRRNGLNTQYLGGQVASAGDFNCDGKDDLAIGAPFATSTPTGAAIAFHEGWVGVWYGDGTLPPQPTEPPDWFVRGNGAALPSESELGWMIAAGDVSGDGCDDIIVGNRATPAGTLANVRAYYGGVGGPDTNFDWRRTIPSFGAALPFAFSGQGDVATGDVNGDGTKDIIVGVPDAGFGQSEEGAVFVWHGGPGLNAIVDGPADPIWRAESNQAGAQLGYSVASGGDVDGDGREDIVAGAPGWDGTIPGSTDSGIALMWKGSATLAATPFGTPVNAAWSLQIGAGSARLGWSVAIPGDVDKDGFGDILAGAPFYDNPSTVGTAEGTVLLTRGASPAPPTDIYSWTHFGQNKGWLGWSVSGAGDTNGDGYADYLMGEPRDNADGTLHGRAHLVAGRPTASWGPNPATDVFFAEVGFPGTPHSEAYGSSVATAGDWNADGFSDIVVGAPGIDNVGPVFSLDGVAFVYLGRVDAVTPINGWTSYPFTQTFGADLHDGIVRLRGALTGGSSPVMFTLPISMRPAGNVYVEADLCNAVQGRIIITPSGTVSVESTTTFSDAQCFTSLEGVNFAPSAAGFTPLALTSGWVGAPFGTTTPAAAKINGIVHLKGAMSSGTSGVAFTLPPGLRPATDVYLPINLCNAAKGRLYIQPSGAAFVSPLGAGDAQCFTSLDGVSFAPTTSSFTPLATLNGWIGGVFGTSAPSATIVRNVVHLKGAVGAGNSTVLFTLPPILRPEASVYLPIDLCNANKGRLFIDPSGSVVVQALTNFSEAQCFTSLDGASFVVPEPTALPALVAGVLLLVGIRDSRTRRGRSAARAGGDGSRRSRRGSSGETPSA